ncbi:hypothetical protein KFL_010770030 [Klebsormidium nitens]|uniref:Glycosyl transferase family 28 C-terminal domain-containing protein n=1 Tax=Klebsormidium nitens TaxID=105231 RepID=A0A1Y1IP29_KLENI|nr:hypothetical protein KFL_010770030 [Klebsormidium nitens]|eukprot:GAQ92630.1 hypothetical protein KFL_010770030 [Klebsormidium nitens]
MRTGENPSVEAVAEAPREAYVAAPTHETSLALESAFVLTSLARQDGAQQAHLAEGVSEEQPEALLPFLLLRGERGAQKRQAKCRCFDSAVHTVCWLGTYIRGASAADRMDLAYRGANLVVGRAGALLVTGTPSLLIPSPNVALSMDSDGAADLMEERQLPPESLLEDVERLLGDRQRSETMRSRALAAAKPNASRDIALAVIGVASLRGKKRPALGLGIGTS